MTVASVQHLLIVCLFVSWLGCNGAAAGGAADDCYVAPGPTSPTVTVVDAVTGTLICDATVVVVGARFVDAGSNSGKITMASEDRDAQAFRFDAGNDATLTQTLTTIGPQCIYSAIFADGATEVTLRVSKAGYRSELVTNIYETFSSNGCDPAAPQVARIALTPLAH